MAPPGHFPRLRRFIVVPLVILFAILVPVTTTVAWTHGLLFNTDRWVSAVGPIPSDPAVATAVGTQLADQVFSSLDVQGRVAGALPPQASFLSGPITTQAQGFVAEQIARVMESPQFENLWVNANRFAHEQVVQILQGHSEVVRDTGGQVVLDLVPLLNAGLQQASSLVSGVVGRPITIPAVTPGEAPAKACARLGSALGVTLPSNCGQIALFPAAKLDRARQLVGAFNELLVVSLVVTPLVAAAALLAARRRRRALLQLVAGAAIGLVVFRRAVNWFDNQLVSSGPPANRGARDAILGHVLHSYWVLTAWMLVALAVVAAAAAVTGPYRWARAVRHATVSGGRALAPHPGAAEPATGWVGAHADALRWGLVGLAVVLILALPLSFIGVVVVLAVLVAALAVVARLAAAPAGGDGTRTTEGTPVSPGGPGPRS